MRLIIYISVIIIVHFMNFSVLKDNWRKVGVYCIINNINGKVYVGSTTTNFRHRYLQYCSGYRREVKTQPILYKAFQKYGFDNFIFKILCITEKENCIEMEQFYIDQGTDYNSCLIAGSLLGFRHSDTSKTRSVIKGEHHCAKPVDMYSLDGTYIQTFTSKIEASKFINISSISNITECCKGHIFSVGGYRWSEAGRPLKERRKRETSNPKICLSKNGEELEFYTQVDAAEYLKSLGHKCNQGRIHRSLSKTKEKVYGFTIKKL